MSSVTSDVLATLDRSKTNEEVHRKCTEPVNQESKMEDVNQNIVKLEVYFIKYGDVRGMLRLVVVQNE